MLIKTQLRLVALLPAVFALLIASVLWLTDLKVNQAQQDAEMAAKVRLANFELVILTQEYLLYGGVRPEKQLLIRHQSMGELLARLEFEEPEERELIEALRQGHEELGSFYKLLLGSNTTARERIIGVLLVKSQDIRAKAEQLANIQYQKVAEIQKLIDRSVMGVLVLLAGVSFMLLALLTLRMTRMIKQLGNGVSQIARGNLDYQIPLATPDELGALAQAFNEMNRKLRESYTSIDKLNDEVAKRQQAEMDIHQLNAELEERVSQRTAELVAANMELEAFSYSVSHDLRAPLRAIDGFSRKVLIGHGDKLDDEGRRQLQVVRDNAQRMGILIDDLLDFSRMGRREMAWQPLNMDVMVKAVADELRAAEPQRTLEFVISPLPQAWGDAAMLRQVWVNLLGNAVKFTRLRPVAHIEVGGSTKGGETLYWIRDNGAGFDMNYAAKLFGVFQRLHRQDEFEGTGVGLAIAQRIVHRHNGRIQGEGKPDAGATFRFALPLPTPENALSGERAS